MSPSGRSITYGTVDSRRTASAVVGAAFWIAIFGRTSSRRLASIARRPDVHLDIQEESVRTRNAIRPGDIGDVKELQRILGRLYEAVRSVSGARVIVDSSKFPVYGSVLAASDSIDASGLLLVRDPRAVAFSRSRQKRLRPDHSEDVGPAYFRRHGVLRSASTWLGWNFLAEISWRGNADRLMRVRYEDFVDDPDTVFRSIGERFDLEVSPPRSDPMTYEVRQSHTLSGNPVRFDSGSVALKADREWVTSMPRSRQLALSLLTLPLLPRYGYLRS
jgi:hypothetical protein